MRTVQSTVYIPVHCTVQLYNIYPKEGDNLDQFTTFSPHPTTNQPYITGGGGGGCEVTWGPGGVSGVLRGTNGPQDSQGGHNRGTALLLYCVLIHC